mmetsp:Transcript_97923/g.310570  ORF Transcript_97923/g.310570 Transcript_97923/m.310570 type:complete len:262 (+) Transcript_97923:63-848(+)
MHWSPCCTQRRPGRLAGGTASQPSASRRGLGALWASTRRRSTGSNLIEGIGAGGGAPPGPCRRARDRQAAPSPPGGWPSPGVPCLDRLSASASAASSARLDAVLKSRALCSRRACRAGRTHMPGSLPPRATCDAEGALPCGDSSPTWCMGTDTASMACSSLVMAMFTSSSREVNVLSKSIALCSGEASSVGAGLEACSSSPKCRLAFLRLFTSLAWFIFLLKLSVKLVVMAATEMETTIAPTTIVTHAMDLPVLVPGTTSP